MCPYHSSDMFPALCLLSSFKGTLSSESLARSDLLGLGQSMPTFWSLVNFFEHEVSQTRWPQDAQVRYEHLRSLLGSLQKEPPHVGKKQVGLVASSVLRRLDINYYESTCPDS